MGKLSKLGLMSAATVALMTGFWLISATPAEAAKPKKAAEKASKKTRKPSATGYECEATAWPVKDYPATFKETVEAVRNLPRQVVFEYFIYELTHIDAKDKTRLDFAKNLGEFITGSEPSEFYRGFAEIVISAAELGNDKVHSLSMDELCEVMKKGAKIDHTPAE